MKKLLILLTSLFFLGLGCGCSSLVFQKVNAAKGDYCSAGTTVPLTCYSDVELSNLINDTCCELAAGVTDEIQFVLQQTFVTSGKFRTVNNYKTTGMRCIPEGGKLLVNPTLTFFDLNCCDNDNMIVNLALIDANTKECVGSVTLQAYSGSSGMHAAISSLGIALEKFLFAYMCNM